MDHNPKAAIVIGAAVVETLLSFVSFVGPFEQAVTRWGVFGFGTCVIWIVAAYALKHVPPDVRLEFTTPGPFVLRNLGSSATEVRVAPFLHSTLFTVTFPPVGDVHSEAVQVTPKIEQVIPGLLAAETTIMRVLEQIARAKAISVQEADSHGVFHSSRITSEIVDFMTYPIELPITITYADQNGKTWWEREETLVYNCAARQGFIRHGKPHKIRKQNSRSST